MSLHTLRINFRNMPSVLHSGSAEIIGVILVEPDFNWRFIERPSVVSSGERFNVPVHRSLSVDYRDDPDIYGLSYERKTYTLVAAVNISGHSPTSPPLPIGIVLDDRFNNMKLSGDAIRERLDQLLTGLAMFLITTLNALGEWQNRQEAIAQRKAKEAAAKAAALKPPSRIRLDE